MNKVIGFYGSWRSPEMSENYQLAKKLGEIAAKHDFTILTGAYSGIMEAAPRGAKTCGGRTLGYSWTKLDKELSPNGFLDTVVTYNRIEERIARSVADTSICVFFPGRTGTVAELAVATEMRAKGEIRLPIALVGDFWLGFFKWLKKSNEALGLPTDEAGQDDLFIRIDSADMFEQFIATNTYILERF